MSDYNKQIEELVRHSTAQGWRHSRTVKGHHQFYAPNRHDIVTMPGTPSDHRGWLNSMADMKRAGYVEPNGGYRAPTLADAIVKVKETNQSTPTAPQQTPRGELSGAIRAYMHARPNKVVNSDDLVRGVQAKVPNSSRDSIIVQTSAAIARGHFERVDRGSYIYRKEEPMGAVAQAVVVQPIQSAPPPDTNHAPAALTDDSLAADITALDTALVALSEIEGVVRRTKEKIDQLMALRKALGG